MGASTSRNEPFPSVDGTAGSHFTRSSSTGLKSTVAGISRSSSLNSTP